MPFAALVMIVAVVAGAVASIAGFGIGSLLTPLLAARMGTGLAVSVVSIPHAIGTAWRLWRLRRAVDWKVLKDFGLCSAVGGLAGALLHASVGGSILTCVFAVLLIFAGMTELLGFSQRFRLGSRVSWFSGLISGLLGGLVGNQGGVRSAALLGVELRRDAFVATATATALLVDAARVPVYLWTDGRSIVEQWPLVVLAGCGVLIGTAIGQRTLRHIPEPVFRKMVALIVLALGIGMLSGGAA